MYTKKMFAKMILTSIANNGSLVPLFNPRRFTFHLSPFMDYLLFMSLPSLQSLLK